MKANGDDGRSPAVLWGQEKGTWVLLVRVQARQDTCHSELCCTEKVPVIFSVWCVDSCHTSGLRSCVDFYLCINQQGHWVLMIPGERCVGLGVVFTGRETRMIQP